MENVIKQLRQFRTDAIYEKKKHYNAADRKRGYYKFISISQIVLNAITGTALLPVVFGEGSKAAEVIALGCTIVATILASIQKIGDYENQSQGNSKAGDMYLRISKKINLVLNLIKDEVLSKQEIINKAEEIQREISEANEIGSQFPTNNGDYKKAQASVKNGDENYTEEELGLWE
ncbi:MAG: SLATT domain-containing protein [Roseburia sp.]|nr:SLATT domain-containing protein [Roseburia sp.]